MLTRAARSFWDFWWDFLIGDTPGLFVATLAIVVVALLLRHHTVLVVIALPLMAIISLVVSTLIGTGRRHLPSRRNTEPKATNETP